MQTCRHPDCSADVDLSPGADPADSVRYCGGATVDGRKVRHAHGLGWDGDWHVDPASPPGDQDVADHDA